MSSLEFLKTTFTYINKNNVKVLVYKKNNIFISLNYNYYCLKRIINIIILYNYSKVNSLISKCL